MAKNAIKDFSEEIKMIAVINSLNKAEDIIVQRLTLSAWNIAYTALWNGTKFSAREKQKAKKLIKDFLLNTTAIELSYEEFVQRVLLTRQYLSNNPEKFLPLPSQWLSKENTMGFAGTHSWFLKLAAKQEAMPLYRSAWKEFAWAIFKMHGRAASRSFHEWRTWFAEKDQRMLNLFLATTANQCYWLADDIAPIENTASSSSVITCPMAAPYIPHS